jgi:hypothetical protein
MLAFQFSVIFPIFVFIKLDLNFQADILNLETKIKECKAELQKVTVTRPVNNTHLETVCSDSENGSNDFVEPTQKKEITPNKMWLV